MSKTYTTFASFELALSSPWEYRRAGYKRKKCCLDLLAEGTRTGGLTRSTRTGSGVLWWELDANYTALACRYYR